MVAGAPGRDAPSQHAGFRLLPEPSQRDRRPSAQHPAKMQAIAVARVFQTITDGTGHRGRVGQPPANSAAQRPRATLRLSMTSADGSDQLPHEPTW